MFLIMKLTTDTLGRGQFHLPVFQCKYTVLICTGKLFYSFKTLDIKKGWLLNFNQLMKKIICFFVHHRCIELTPDAISMQFGNICAIWSTIMSCNATTKAFRGSNLPRSHPDLHHVVLESLALMYDTESFKGNVLWWMILS